MYKMRFARPIKYGGEIRYSNTEFEVKSEDIEDMKKLGGWITSEPKKEVKAEPKKEVKKEVAETKPKKTIKK